MLISIRLRLDKNNDACPLQCERTAQGHPMPAAFESPRSLGSTHTFRRLGDTFASVDFVSGLSVLCAKAES